MTGGWRLSPIPQLAQVDGAVKGWNRQGYEHTESKIDDAKEEKEVAVQRKQINCNRNYTESKVQRRPVKRPTNVDETTLLDTIFEMRNTNCDSHYQSRHRRIHLATADNVPQAVKEVAQHNQQPGAETHQHLRANLIGQRENHRDCDSRNRHQGNVQSETVCREEIDLQEREQLALARFLNSFNRK